MATARQKDTFMAQLAERVNERSSAGNIALRRALDWSREAYDEVRQALLQEGTITLGGGKGGSVSISVSKDQFIVALANIGGSAGNNDLRTALGWRTATYDAVKQVLLQEGTITLGGGKGGSVSISVLKDQFLEALAGKGGSAGNQALRTALGWRTATYDAVKQVLLQEDAIEQGPGFGGVVSIIGKFMAALANEGGSAGNKALRTALGWNEEIYNGVREVLLDNGTIDLGRGRGGSVSISVLRKDQFMEELKNESGSADNNTLRIALGWHRKIYDAVKQVLLQKGAIERNRGRDNSVSIRDVRLIGDDEPVPLLDEWPGLADYLADESPELIRCDRIIHADKEVPSYYSERDASLYLARKESEREELRTISDGFELDLGDDALNAILHRQITQDVEAAQANVRQYETDAERLLAAVGKEGLLDRLPGTLIEILRKQPEPLDGRRAAEAAIAVFHTGALREYKDDIQHLRPPDQWAGGSPALAFVRALGFGPDWAGQPKPNQPPFLDISGPRSLPDLHCYQRTIVDNVKAMLRGGDPSSENRGMVSMPTGSGKTRVAVQAVIEAIRDQGLGDAVLWVADRGELCDQAVEAWRQAWTSIGPQRKSLRVSRWWGGQPQPESVDSSHVIVATIQTLRKRLEHWTTRTVFDSVGLLVVDEAHGTMAPTFTRLMDKLGLTYRRNADEPFLLGLTATPYRGYNEEETRLLVARYGNQRLDTGAFESDTPQDVIAQLQEMTVLAEADHVTIEGGDFTLTDEERREIQDDALPWFPQSVERRIAESAPRTQGIVDAYMEQVVGEIGEDAPTLVFATSVEHAKTVAAMLQLEGVEARAVSGETELAVRRGVVQQFREGEVKVLVNYGVFREGFDAPKTRAIIVARPVYSPNLYFQMIGRGLRGRLNGGSDRCLILDVKDNIKNYDRELAFADLDWLWARGAR